jgi:hypothetical protein
MKEAFSASWDQSILFQFYDIKKNWPIFQKKEKNCRIYTKDVPKSFEFFWLENNKICEKEITA